MGLLGVIGIILMVVAIASIIIKQFKNKQDGK
jgi:hypothetical protein